MSAASTVEAHPTAGERAGRGRARARGLLRAATLWAVLGGLGLTKPWAGLEHGAFDLLQGALPPPPEAAASVVLVGIDEPSFAELRLRWPWPRDLHAELLDALSGAGAAAIGFDVLFAEEAGPDEDAALVEAIRRSGKVVLAADVAEIETRHIAQEIRVEPLPALLDAGARAGNVRIALDPDGVVRALPTDPGSFAATLLTTATGAPAPTAPAGALMRFFPHDRGFERVSYYQALAPGELLPPDLLKGRTVIVGLTVATTPEPGRLPADTFLTPLTLTRGTLAAGAEIQATALVNLAHGLWVVPVGHAVQLAVLALALLAASAASRPWVPARALQVLAGGIVLTVAACVELLTLARLWLPPMLPIAGMALATLVEGGNAYLFERRARRFIKRAFGRYLAPELVDALARDPGRLRLGGERRAMTFLFCDIRGFTSISERLQQEPERLIRLINRFLSPMTRVIQAERGTIDKYMGDCIMAFWNAPLDDPDHAAHACAAALGMMAALRDLNAELAQDEPDLPPLKIGIGINTGEAIVGNVGSDVRFAYSVLGDAVNLASRLESLSKTYGVEVIVGEATAAAVGERFALLELDRVAVRGKAQAGAILTLLGGAELARDPAFRQLRADHDRLLAALRAGDSRGASTALEACLGNPRAPVAAYRLYRERIEHGMMVAQDQTT